MAEIWLTADLHADHKSALKYRTEFSTVDEMADHFVDEHNAVVAPGDRVYNLGDVFFRAKRDVPASLRYLKRLNGQSYLVHTEVGGSTTTQVVVEPVETPPPLPVPVH